jgi:dolichyl-phosphate beta-glucosyltransferase
MTELSVVIPAFNEAQRLEPSLRSVLGFLARRGRPFEVLVVDDGSSDGTAEVAGRFADQGVRVLVQPRNRGKGAALKAGVLASRGAAVLLTDADLSTPIEELAKLEPYLSNDGSGVDLVLGSRAVAGADIRQHQPFYREWMGKVFNLLIRLLGVRGVHDTQCGFKLLRGDVARRLFAEMSIEGFAYDVEMIWLARRHGYRLAEVGVIWSNSAASKVDPLRSSFEMFRDVLRIRFARRR